MTDSAAPAGRHRFWLACALPVIVLALMQWSAVQDGAPRYAVAPTRIARTLWELAGNGSLWLDMAASAVRAYSGFAIGATLGVAIGLLCSMSRALASFFDPLVSTLYPVPKVALLPVIITWLGFGNTSKIAIIALAVFFPTFINSLYGARGVPQRLVWAARNMGAKGATVFWRVVLPGALPQVFTGLRSGLALSFVVLFAAEMVGARDGLGNLIIKAEESMRYDWMYAAIVTIGAMGFVSDRLLNRLRRHLLAGKFPGEGERA